MPSVSIGMSVKDSAATIALSIASVISQDFSDWELILIDDGSSDGTGEIIRRFQDSRIRLVTFAECRGLAARLNEAVRLSAGEFFARMDGDDLMYPGRLRLQYDYLKEHPSVDLVAGGELVFKGDGIVLGLRCSEATHHLTCAHPWRGIPLAHPTWMGRMQWFRENPYPEDLIRAEDQALLLLSLKKSHFAILGEILIGYREEPRSASMLLKVRYHAIRAYWRNRLDFVSGVKSVAWHMVSGAVDMLACACGVDRGVFKRNTAPPAPEQLRQWEEIWLQNRAASVKLQQSLGASSHEC